MPGFDDLTEHLEWPQCECLNASAEHTLRHAIEKESQVDSSVYLESDADEELLVKLKFMSEVKVSAIIIGAADSADTAPKDVKLFVNKVGLDFDNAKSDKATQDVSLSKSDVVAGTKKELRFVNFQKVQELGIFIANNQGDEETTKVGKITILGETVTHSGLKRSAEEQASATKSDWLGKGIS